MDRRFDTFQVAISACQIILRCDEETIRGDSKCTTHKKIKWNYRIIEIKYDELHDNLFPKRASEKKCSMCFEIASKMFIVSSDV